MGFSTSIHFFLFLLAVQRGDGLSARRLDRGRLSVLQEMLLAAPGNNSEIARMAELDKTYKVGNITTFITNGFIATRGTMTEDAVCVIILDTFYWFDDIQNGGNGDRKINRAELDSILAYIGESGLGDATIDHMMSLMDDLTVGDQLLQGPEFFFWFHWPEMDGVTNYPGNFNNLETTIEKYKEEVDWNKTQEQAFYDIHSRNMANRSKAQANRTGPGKCVNVNQTALRHAQESDPLADWDPGEPLPEKPNRPKGMIKPLSTQPNPAAIKSCFGALTQWRESIKINFFHSFFDFDWDFRLSRGELGIIYSIVYPGVANGVIDTVFANLDIQTTDNGIDNQEFYIFFNPGFLRYEQSLIQQQLTGGNSSVVRHPCLE